MPRPKMPARTRTALKQFKRKKVWKKQIERFWAEWGSSKTRARGLLIKSSVWERNVWPLASGALATVRRFSRASDAKKYIENTRKFEEKIKKAKPKKFKLQTVQFFDLRDSFLLERVYRAPDCFNFLKDWAKTQRYYNSFARRLKRKRVDLENAKDLSEIQKNVREAVEELNQIVTGRFQGYGKLIGLAIRDPYSKHPVNTLLLDYDPKTGKVLLAQIDLENPVSYHE